MTTENTSMDFCVEKRYKPDELAELLGYSVDTIYRIFRNEPGGLEVAAMSRCTAVRRRAFALRTRFICAGMNAIDKRRKPGDIFVHTLHTHPAG